MNSLAAQATIAALISSTNAIRIEATPDVFGPNGAQYSNESPSTDFANIGIDIVKKGRAGAKKC